MEMRLRLPELLKASGVTPYRLAKASGDRISLSTVYRLMKRRGAVQFVEMETLDAICDVLGVPPSELLTRDDEKPPPAARPAKQTRKGQG
jgi:DNA-binding Xre family transcriptional regulator